MTTTTAPATRTAPADLLDQLDGVAVTVTAYGPGWTEAPFACCGDCGLVFHDGDLAYDSGADDWLCPLCVVPADDDGGPCCIAVVTSGGRDHVPGCRA